MFHKLFMVHSLKEAALEEVKHFQQDSNTQVAKLTYISHNKTKVLKSLKNALNFLMERLITDNTSKENFLVKVDLLNVMNLYSVILKL